MPRFKQNGHVGGEINMTIREDVRRKIQLISGRIFVIGGLGMLLTVLGSGFYYLKRKGPRSDT
ncbi:MAG TPA: hypothetical protein VGI33_07045 [Paenibacillus sp.]|jgi:hypothetical protein